MNGKNERIPGANGQQRMERNSLQAVFDNTRAICTAYPEQGKAIRDSRFERALEVLGLPDPREVKGLAELKAREEQVRLEAIGGYRRKFDGIFQRGRLM